MPEAGAGPWYWCLNHGRVEGRDGCANEHRMGPYTDREQAETALQRAQERAETWDAEDAAERDWGKPPA